MLPIWNSHIPLLNAMDHRRLWKNLKFMLWRFGNGQMSWDGQRWTWGISIIKTWKADDRSNQLLPFKSRNWVAFQQLAHQRWHHHHPAPWNALNLVRIRFFTIPYRYIYIYICIIITLQWNLLLASHIQTYTS